MLNEMPAEKDISTAVANVVPPNSSACQCACGVLVPVIEVCTCGNMRKWAPALPRLASSRGQVPLARDAPSASPLARERAEDAHLNKRCTCDTFVT